MLSWSALIQMNIITIPKNINPLNAELNPICYFLALLGAHPFLHVSRIRVNYVTLLSSKQPDKERINAAFCQGFQLPIRQNVSNWKVPLPQNL